jgi:hypothetical protein
VRSQILAPNGTGGGTEAKDRSGNTQTVTSGSQPDFIRTVGFSTPGNPILNPGTSPANLAAPPPSVVETKDKDTQRVAIAATNPPAPAVPSAPSAVGDRSASQLSQEQPRGNALFPTGFDPLLGFVGAVFLGVLVQLVGLALILRHFGAHLARVFRVELVNPAAVGIVGQVSAARLPTVAAGPAPEEATPSSTAESFDIGSTYAEAMREKQEALRRQEEAVLQHIFELNMQMRAQLGQLSGGAA